MPVKKINNHYFKFITVIVLALLTSCTEWKDVKVSKIEQTRISKMDKDGIEAEIDVRINNPNKIGFKIYRSNVDVLMNDNSLGKGRLKKKIRIKPNTEETYTFVVAGKFDNLLSGSGLSGLLSMATSKTANISIKGNIKAGKFFYKKKFPIDNKQRVPLFK